MAERSAYLASLLQGCIAETGACKPVEAPLFEKHAQWLKEVKESLSNRRIK